MATITFKAKCRAVYNMDDTVAFHIIDVPKLTRAHCDMPAFRKHPKYSGLVNSDLFPNVLSHIKRDVAPHGWIKLEAPPASVQIDTSGFLAVVTIEV